MSDTKRIERKNELAQFLKKKIAHNERAAKVTWIVGLIVFLLVTCYMSTVVLVVRGMLQPVIAANMIRQRVEANLPLVLTGMEHSLTQNAPAAANRTSEAVLAMIPDLRKKAEALIDKAVERDLPDLRSEMRKTVRVYLEQHADEFAVLRDAHSEPEVAKIFVEDMAATMRNSIDAGLRDEWGDAAGSNLEVTSLIVLTNIRDELSKLIETETDLLTEEERLKRRVIVTWIQMLNEATAIRSPGLADSMAR